MFLKVPEGFQRKKISSCTETLLLPRIEDDVSKISRQNDDQNGPGSTGHQPEDDILWHVYTFGTFLV